MKRGSRQINRLMGELKHTHALGTRQRRMLRTLDNRYGLNGEFEMAEVGVAEGFSSELLLRFFQNMSLHMIDSWSDDDQAKQLEHDRKKKEAICRVSFYPGRYRILAEASVHASGYFSNESLDVVFLDAAHSYECVRADLNLWWPKVKPGGIFCGDDYNGQSERLGHKGWGVKRAVDEFFLFRGMEVRIGAKNFFWIDKL